MDKIKGLALLAALAIVSIGGATYLACNYDNKWYINPDYLKKKKEA